MGGHHMTVEEVKKHVRVYIGVFVALLFLTVLTVSVSYLQVSMPVAITVAMVVALAKGSLVCLYFMHLSNEKRIIYAVLALTAILFAFLMMISFY